MPFVRHIWNCCPTAGESRQQAGKLCSAGEKTIWMEASRRIALPSKATLPTPRPAHTRWHRPLPIPSSVCLSYQRDKLLTKKAPVLHRLLQVSGSSCSYSPRKPYSLATGSTPRCLICAYPEELYVVPVIQYTQFVRDCSTAGKWRCEN